MAEFSPNLFTPIALANTIVINFGELHPCSGWNQGCQMVCFQTKNPNLG
jgi:hypothetical protein